MNRAMAAERVRQSPLVFPNVRWSPFARSRAQAYELDETGADPHALADLDDWLRAMPVPLVGIPWYQMAHLPEAVFIGHEVGHLVEEDLGLEGDLAGAIESKLATAPEQRRAAWSRHWRSEVFADVYGVLTTGSAYVAALLDLLGGDSGLVETELQPQASRPVGQEWSSYPTRAIRAQLVCEVLRQLPAGAPDPALLATLADEHRTRWSTAYPAHAMPEYVDDIPGVVAALLSSPLPAFGERPVTDVLSFSVAQEMAARRDAGEANRQGQLKSGDVRALFAGVTHAFLEDPAAFVASRAHDRFRNQLLQRRGREVRRADVLGIKPVTREARHKETARAVLERVGRSFPG